MVVLALDDENLALKALMKSIEKADENAEVHGFRDSDEAFAFFEENPVDVAFLDIQMRGENGIEVAKKIKLLYPQTNIIFTTGFSEYQQDAFKLHASGYILKPVNAEKVKDELDNLRYPIERREGERVRIQTFGNFEVYVDGKTLHFGYDKSKELLAYLVDRKGAMCSTAEAMAVLWEDDSHTSYFSNVRADLLKTFEDLGLQDIFFRQRGKLGINREMVECDLYDWMDGNPAGINAFHGEYMNQYSWGEFELAKFYD